MKFISAFSDFITKIIRYMILVIFIILTVVSIVEVVRRYLFGQSYPWSDEMCRYLLVWLGFFGGSLALRKNNLVRFDVGHDKLSEHTREVLGLVVYSICLLFTAALCVLSWRWTFSFAARNQAMLSIPLSMTWVYIPMPFSFAFMSMFCVEKLYAIAMRLKPQSPQSEGV
jgi:TRAP-type C4-dicarboxylate transport system permease small subunit